MWLNGAGCGGWIEIHTSPAHPYSWTSHPRLGEWESRIGPTWGTRRGDRRKQSQVCCSCTVVYFCIICMASVGRCTFLLHNRCELIYHHVISECTSDKTKSWQRCIGWWAQPRMPRSHKSSFDGLRSGWNALSCAFICVCAYAVVGLAFSVLIFTQFRSQLFIHWEIISEICHTVSVRKPPREDSTMVLTSLCCPKLTVSHWDFHFKVPLNCTQQQLHTHWNTNELFHIFVTLLTKRNQRLSFDTAYIPLYIWQ